MIRHWAVQDQRKWFQQRNKHTKILQYDKDNLQQEKVTTNCWVRKKRATEKEKFQIWREVQACA